MVHTGLSESENTRLGGRRKGFRGDVLYERRGITEAFERLREKAGLPNVAFHSLRASSATYKLKMSGGDFKAIQGDTGPADLKVLTQVYARILDEDRKIDAIKFESEYYRNAHYLRSTAPPEQEAAPADVNALIQQLQNSPELAASLAKLIVNADGPISKKAKLLAV